MNTFENINDYATTEENPLGFELTDRDDTPFHTHSFVEIFYVVNGNIEHLYKTDGGEKTVLHLYEGDMFILMHNDAHCFLRHDGNTCTHRDLIIRDNFFKDVCDYINPTLYDDFRCHKIPNPVHISPEKITEFEHNISLIVQMFSSPYSKLTISKTLLVSIISQYILQNTERSFQNIPSWFKSLLANFDKVQFMQMGLPMILMQFNYDNKYLCHVFKKYMGMTMTEYLNQKRLMHATNLLKNTNFSISEIAQTVGFSSVSYFNVIFKKKYGVTPKKLRK